MPTFNYPSSTPSTPASQKRPTSNIFDQSHPSTTPAGPPPSSAKSFLPGGPGPSLFGAGSQRNAGSTKPIANINFGNGKQVQTQSQTTKVRLNDLPQADEVDDEDEEDDADGEDDMEAEYPDLPGNGDEDEEDFDWNNLEDNTRRDVTRNGPRMSNRANVNDQGQFSASAFNEPESVLSLAVRNLKTLMGDPVLDEPDKLILQTEQQVNKLYNDQVSAKEQDEILARALKVVPAALSRVWQNCCNDIDHSTDEERGDGVGPLDEDPVIYKAAYVGSLLLLINHPPTRILEPAQQLRYSVNNKAVAIATAEAYPKALIDWLDANHNPYRSGFFRLLKVQPNPTASSNFWDLLLSNTLRGQIANVANLLANSDLSHALSAKDDGSATRGYKDQQLQTASRVVGRAAAVLQACPALQNGDWHVTNDAWANWRLRIEEELAELIRAAEGEDQAAGFRASFEAENFGIATSSKPLSTSTRRAQSKVPWTVYENLKSVYNIVLGSPVDIINYSQDWLEASMALTIWWDGTDTVDLNATTSLRHSRRRQPQARRVDIDIVKAYRQRLLEAFDAVSQEEALQINEHNAVEVAIASILDGNIQDAFTILRAWSIPITSAIMEVGAEAGWYESVYTELTPDLLDESDLMVLSYAKQESQLSKDSVLVEYAAMLLERGSIQHEDIQLEGWQMAVELAGRIDNHNLGVRTAQDTIKTIAITTDDRANKVISICKEFDLPREASEVAEKYGDTIAETTANYGTALVYYARAHHPKKVKDVLDLLISYCLVQSTAFPPTEKLDNFLSDLLLKPRTSLTSLAKEDKEAAEILSAQFSGYATIRKFYDIRDQADGSKKYRSLNARREAAADVLITTIQSAADNIQGGLYDAENPAVIPVDGLLALLGEVNVFVNQKPRILKMSQLITLLRAIEDLHAIHPRIKAQCAEFFSSTIAAGHGASQPDPRELMKKSISDLTASSGFSQSTGFSLISGSKVNSGIGSSYANITASTTSSNGTKDNRKRAWDWRQEYRRDAKPGHLLKRLRLGLAEEVGSAWIEESI